MQYQNVNFLQNIRVAEGLKKNDMMVVQIFSLSAEHWLLHTGTIFISRFVAFSY